MRKAVIIGIAAILLTACGGSANTPAESPQPKENTTVAAETENATTSSPENVVDNRTKASEDTSSEKESETEQATEPIPEKKEVTDEDFSFKDYLYESSLGSSMYYLIVTNNSDETVSLSASGIAKDSNGNTIGADDMSIDVIGPGETTIGYFYFKSASGIDTVEYKTKYDVPKYYEPVVGNLSVKQTLNDKNAIIEVTNNGSIPAEFVQGYAFFIDNNGKVVDQEDTYFTDDDSEIKPGDTIVKQMNTRKEFDHVDIYFTGRASKY